MSKLFSFVNSGTEIDDCLMIEEDGMTFVSNGEDFIHPITQDSPSGSTRSGGDVLPASVGGYIVSTLLGKGGFGEVRLGIHQLTSEKVALKFLRTADIVSIAAAERTVTEIQCLTALRHNNIIKLFQVDKQIDVPYYSQF